MDWGKKIERLTAVSGHLDYIQKMIMRKDISPLLRKRTLNELGLIQKRIADDKLYITVIGRASTGKSTFINALLKDALLKSGVLTMTTSAATIVRYGEKLSLEVRFKKNAAIRALGLEGLEENQETPYLEILPDEINTDQTFLWKVTTTDEPVAFEGRKKTIRELIHLLTASEKYAESIVSVSITHPSPFLKSGIVIIDTPGADALNSTHKEITRSAVERADASVIITPGEQAVSGWLVDILKAPDFLYPLLHRCVFMVTRMDIARERMRRIGRNEAIALVHEDAIRRLKAGLAKIGLKEEPRVYISAAQAVVDEFSGEGPIVSSPEERDYWQVEFNKFQKDFVDFMVLQRAETIAERILRLLDSLFDSLEAHLSELWDGYNKKANRFKAIVQNINSFCSEQAGQWNKRINNTTLNATYELETAVRKEKENGVKWIRGVIFDAENVEELKSAVKYKVEDELNRSVKRIESLVRKQMGTIDQTSSTFREDFEEKFRELYEKLKLLSDNNDVSEIKPLDLKIASQDLSPSNGNLLEDTSAGNFIGGAVIGGIIGSIIPGIGTLAGALIGGVIGSFFEPSLDQRKNAIWDELAPRIDSLYSDLNQRVIQNTHNYGRTVWRNMEKHIDQYAKSYHPQVEQIRLTQAREKKELEELQATLEQDLNGLKKCRIQIREKKETLRLNNRIALK